MTVAYYDTVDDEWKTEVVEYGVGISFDAVIKFDPDETKLGIGYTSGRLPKVAEKTIV